MKTLLVRGKPRLVGNVKQPSEADVLWLKARGFFHELVERVTDPSGAPLAHPATLDLVTPCLACLSTMLGNGPDPANPPLFPNGVGCCVLADDNHLAAMRATLAGAPYTPTTAQNLADYGACTGFSPTDANSDQGTDPIAWLKWRLGGAPYPDGSKLLDARLVDVSNDALHQQAIWLADGIAYWASLPDGVESEENGGDTWDVCGPPNPDNGHGFGGGGYDAVGVPAIEWGEENPPIKLTYAFIKKYCIPSAGGGAVALLGSNAFASISGKCPAGYDLSGLEGVFASLGAEAS